MQITRKNTSFLSAILVILCISVSVSGCLTEAGNNYKLSNSVKKMEGGTRMGKVSDAEQAYSNAKFVSHDH